MSDVVGAPGAVVEIVWENFTPGLGTPVLGAQLVDNVGGTPIARTVAGLAETPAGSGRYVWRPTLPLTEGTYGAILDQNSGTLTPGFFATVDVLVNSGFSIGVPVVINTPDATLDSLTFTIKRNDTVPYIRRQLKYADGTLPDLSVAGTTVYFNARPKSGANTKNAQGGFVGSPKIHGLAVIIDVATSIVEYRWPNAGDTDTADDFYFEWEVNYPGGVKVETFPKSDWGSLTIIADLDPGLTP